MTNLQALQSIIGVNYPFDANSYLKNLIDQDVDPDGSYTKSDEKAIDLAFAGMLKTVIVSVDIKEGGYQITNADRSALIVILNGIYSKYGMVPFTASYIKDISCKW